MAQIKVLSPELQKIAITDLGEVPERIPEDLQAFKTWIKQQPHLKARTDDQFLIQFLRGCKYSLEKAKQKLDMFYALKTRYSELFNPIDVDSEKFRKLHNTGPLNDCGSRIVVLRYNYNSQDFNANELIQFGVAVIEVMLMNDPYACVYGVKAIFDMSEATASHLMQFTPNITKQFALFFEKAFPIRLKSLCFINLSKYSHQFFNIVLPHITEKFRKRVVLCGKNIEDLVEHVPKTYLPIEYGGKNGSLDQLYIGYNKVWDDNREFFKQNVKYGTNETLRIGEPMNFDRDLGISGSFRKLNVD